MNGSILRNSRKKGRVLILGALFAALLLLGVSAETSAADSSSDTWDHHKAERFSGGDGSQENPYQIASPQELAKLASDINSGIWERRYAGTYFKLTEDVDLGAYRWIPIGRGSSGEGNSHQAFMGHFDGNGKTIAGLFVDEGTQDYAAGLFGNVGTYGWEVEIKNLTLSGADVRTWWDNGDFDRNGGGAGLLAGTATSPNVRIENCHVSGRVSGAKYTGGLVGYCSYASFEDCSAKVEVSGYAVNGGFAGGAYYSSFTDCQARGSVNARGWANGGFVGALDTQTRASHCLADCSVSGADWNNGGFVGWTEGQVTIEQCVSLGDVTSTVTDWSPRLGGFVGCSSSDCVIRSCHGAGKVTGASEVYSAGGFLGCDLGGSLVDCSFDAGKNGDLQAVGQVETAGSHQITGGSTEQVASNICRDYYGGHTYSQEWTVDREAACTQVGSKSRHCIHCGGRTDVTELPASGHVFDSALDGECNVCGFLRPIGEPDVTVRIRQRELTEVSGELGETPFETVEKIKEELLRVLTLEGSCARENTAFYDVILMLSADGVNWEEADESNFPKDGITVFIAYPEGTGRDTHEFVVTHMFGHTSERLGTVAGETEQPSVTKLEKGIQVTLKGLSPVGLGWRAVEQGNPGGDGDSSGQGEKPSAGDQRPQGADTSSAGVTPAKNSPRTGQETGGWLYLVLAVALSCLGAVLWRPLNWKRACFPYGAGRSRRLLHRQG